MAGGLGSHTVLLLTRGHLLGYKRSLAIGIGGLKGSRWLIALVPPEGKGEAAVRQREPVTVLRPRRCHCWPGWIVMERQFNTHTCTDYRIAGLFRIANFADSSVAVRENIIREYHIACKVWIIRNAICKILIREIH